MNGYVKNKSVYWRHALKRSIGPGHEIPLDELFDQYGVKHELEQGKPFIDWLRTVKLKDDKVWDIVYTEDSENKTVSEDVEYLDEANVNDDELVDKKSSKNSDIKSSLPSFVKKEISPTDIANFTVREARSELKRITDIKLVRYAYEQARQLSNKDSLCNMLRKRIQELELTRR